ncbi:MAG: sulfotransferase family protein [Acidimicrobiia bacterium]
MAIKLPNFFILGAGRSGTTTLHFTLRDHPEVFLPTPKEPSFFCEPFQVIRNPIKYASLFEGADRAVAVGDSSHAHLTHPNAARTIKAFFPDARFVLIFRNPADRALAMYSYMLENGYEHLSTVEKALAAEDKRFHSEHFRTHCPYSFWNFMYSRSGRFGEQVARYLEHYPRERFYVTTLYDLQRDPDRVLGDLEEFIGVTRRTHGPLGRYGSSKGVKSVQLQLLERRVIRKLARRHVPLMESSRQAINRWNRGHRPTMLPETRAELVERHRPDLALLTELTGVDVLAAEQAARDDLG